MKRGIFQWRRLTPVRLVRHLLLGNQGQDIAEYAAMLAVILVLAIAR
jgi:hypothetical protein